MNALQSKLGRTALGWGVRELAKEAQVSIDTITRLEKGIDLLPRTSDAICTALERAGVQFLNEGDTAAGPGVALRSVK